MIQLKLWTDDDGRVPVQCSHCGTVFDAREQLERRKSQVLDDPRVKALPGPSRAFLVAALPLLVAAPEPIGPRTIANEISYTPAAARYQLMRLADFGIIRPRLMRTGGKYHRYELAIS